MLHEGLDKSKWERGGEGKGQGERRGRREKEGRTGLVLLATHPLPAESRTKYFRRMDFGCCRGVQHSNGISEQGVRKGKGCRAEVSSRGFEVVLCGSRDGLRPSTART